MKDKTRIVRNKGVAQDVSRMPLPVYQCKVCGHRWIPRKAKIYVCPNRSCHSPRWNG